MITSHAPGIHSVELLTPLADAGAFFRRLHRSIQTATTLRAAVAYWTIEPQYVHADFPALLSAPDSFLCVDLHLPTSIDQLCRLDARIAPGAAPARPGAHLYIHLRSFVGQPEVPHAGREMPAHLLHPKLLLFTLPDGGAEIWVGSHNWTHRALAGMNIEATVVLGVAQESALYHETGAALQAMRDLCTPFDRTLGSYYKWLQGLLEPQVLFELEGHDAAMLACTQIKLFGTEPRDFEKLTTVGKKVYLSMLDSRTGAESLYRAEITTASASAIDIKTLAAQLWEDQQRYVYRQGRVLPVLEPPRAQAQPGPLADAAYCVALKVNAALPQGVRVLEPQHEDKWVDAPEDVLLARLQQPHDAEVLVALPEYQRGVREIVRKVALKVPVHPAQFLQPYIRTLAQKRAAPNRELFTRKYVDDPV